MLILNKITNRLKNIISKYLEENCSIQELSESSISEKKLFNILYNGSRGNIYLRSLENLKNYNIPEVVLLSLAKMPKNDTLSGLWQSDFKSWENFYRDDLSKDWIDECVVLSSNEDDNKNISAIHEEIKDIFSELQQILIIEMGKNCPSIKLFKIENNQSSINQYLQFLVEQLSDRSTTIKLVKKLDNLYWATVTGDLSSFQLNSLQKLVNIKIDEIQCKLFLEINDKKH